MHSDALLLIPSIVLATGGGVVLNRDSCCLIGQHAKTVWLRVSSAEAVRRLGTGKGRPLLENSPDPGAQARKIAAARAPLYYALADLSIDTGRLSIQQTAERIATWIKSGYRV